MKSASPALIELLNSSQQFYMADLYTFTLVGGFVARYTDAEMDLVVGGQTFSGTGPLIRREATRTVIGIEVDTLNIEVTAQAGHQLNGTPWLAAIRNGGLDGARVQLERVFMPTYGDTSAGAVILFGGRVAECELGRVTAKITVKSDLELLNVKMPRNLYQPSCPNSLFDGACGLNKSTFAINGTVAAGSSLTSVVTGLSQPAGYFDLGTISFNTGANAGLTRSVRSWANGTAKLALPLLAACAAGDSVTLYPGCDKLLATCEGKFNNRLNFRGQPFVPVPESVY